VGRWAGGSGRHGELGGADAVVWRVVTVSSKSDGIETCWGRGTFTRSASVLHDADDDRAEVEGLAFFGGHEVQWHVGRFHQLLRHRVCCLLWKKKIWLSFLEPWRMREDNRVWTLQ
jgi:hypothetical protein